MGIRNKKEHEYLRTDFRTAIREMDIRANIDLFKNAGTIVDDINKRRKPGDPELAPVPIIPGGHEHPNRKEPR